MAMNKELQDRELQSYKKYSIRQILQLEAAESVFAFNQFTAHSLTEQHNKDLHVQTYL